MIILDILLGVGYLIAMVFVWFVGIAIFFTIFFSLLDKVAGKESTTTFKEDLTSVYGFLRGDKLSVYEVLKRELISFYRFYRDVGRVEFLLQFAEDIKDYFSVEETPVDEYLLSDELLIYNDPSDETFMYPCRSCQELSEIYNDYDELEHFDPSMHYCGKNQWCCP